MAFYMTSEQAKALRARLTAKQMLHPWDRRAWLRKTAAALRARRIQYGVCVRCGGPLVEKFRTCLECRVKRSQRRAA
jgi:RNA polymerase-binding transcription factor DksA